MEGGVLYFYLSQMNNIINKRCNIRKYLSILVCITLPVGWVNDGLWLQAIILMTPEKIEYLFKFVQYFQTMKVKK